MNVSRTKLRRPFQGAVTKAKFVNRIPGLLGRPDGGAAFTVTVPGGKGYKFVRMLQGIGVSLSIAIDRAGVGTTGDTPIYLDYDSDQRLIIVGLRYEGA